MGFVFASMNVILPPWKLPWAWLWPTGGGPRAGCDDEAARHGAWDQGSWSASGKSCRGLIKHLHLVGGCRILIGKGPLRGQGTKRELGAKRSGISHGGRLF